MSAVSNTLDWALSLASHKPEPQACRGTPKPKGSKLPHGLEGSNLCESTKAGGLGDRSQARRGSVVTPGVGLPLGVSFANFSHWEKEEECDCHRDPHL